MIHPLKLFASLVVIFLCINLASASYITGTIELDKEGNAKFNLETDKPIALNGISLEGKKLAGNTNELTTLHGGIWTFDLNLSEYDDIFLNIELPNSLESITSIRGSDNIIDIEKKEITIADSGKLQFSVSYKLQDKLSLIWFYWTLSIILVAGGFYLYKKKTKKKERLESIMPIINENEQKIVDALMKAPKRQKELRKELNIPKASFTRYVINLEKKKLIIREGESKNKILKLK